MADNVQFIGPREGGAGAPPERSAGRLRQPAQPFSDRGLEPADGDFAEDDDIPF